jgi:hypothetical protein
MSHQLWRIGKLKSAVDQAKHLQRLEKVKPTMIMLAYCYNPEIVFQLPEGETPLRERNKIEINDEPGLLYGEIRRLYLFVDGPGGKSPLNQVKREKLWIELLEYVHPDDAKLLDQVKNGKIPGISAKTVLMAFPGLFQNDAEKV